jgi:hypothetical protein
VKRWCGCPTWETRTLRIRQLVWCGSIEIFFFTFSTLNSSVLKSSYARLSDGFKTLTESSVYRLWNAQFSYQIEKKLTKLFLWKPNWKVCRGEPNKTCIQTKNRTARNKQITVHAIQMIILNNKQPIYINRTHNLHTNTDSKTCYSKM